MSTVTIAATRVVDEALDQEFESIFEQHCRFVYRTAYSVTGNRQDAEDVVQTIFMKLLERKLSSDLLRNPRPYLYRAAINASLNSVRDSTRRKLDHGVDPATVARQPEATTDTLMQRRLLDAIARLKPPAVEVLILHYEHGYSDTEIAQMLGKSRGAVAVMLNRTRAQLKELLRASSGEKQ